MFHTKKFSFGPRNRDYAQFLEDDDEDKAGESHITIALSFFLLYVYRKYFNHFKSRLPLLRLLALSFSYFSIRITLRSTYFKGLLSRELVR